MRHVGAEDRHEDFWSTAAGRPTAFDERVGCTDGVVRVLAIIADAAAVENDLPSRCGRQEIGPPVM